jgi:POT family proton-dependent oligopeptide transporter
MNPFKTYRQFKAPDFWESAKPSKQTTKPAWMNFDDEWVDQVSRGFKACGVFIWYPLYCKWDLAVERYLPKGY